MLRKQKELPSETRNETAGSVTDLRCLTRFFGAWRQHEGPAASGCAELGCQEYRRLPGPWYCRCKREGEVSMSIGYGTPVARLSRILR